MKNFPYYIILLYINILANNSFKRVFLFLHYIYLNILQNEDSVCLAKFCDVFRCEVVLAAMESENGKTSSNTLPTIYNHQKNLIPCDDRKMSALQKKCKVSMKFEIGFS